MHRAVLRISSLVCLLVAASCSTPPQAESPASGSNDQTAPQSSAQTSDDLGPMLPGIQKEELSAGVGPEVKKGDRIRVHYTGTLLDGTKFDSSLDRGVPLEFVVGGGSVITGWDLGVVGMKRGGKRKLTIPPHLAYGERGAPPKIGPNATLVFVIELVDIL